MSSSTEISGFSRGASCSPSRVSCNLHHMVRIMTHPYSPLTVSNFKRYARPLVLSPTVLGVFFILQLSSPSSSPYSNAGQPINWTGPYLCVSLAINIVLTFLIVIRLLLYRRTMAQLLGPGHATECTTVVAMLIESAAVYTTFVLLFLIPFALQNSVSYTFVQVMGEAQVSRSIRLPPHIS